MSLRHILYSLLLHLAAAGLLIVSFNISPTAITQPPPPSGSIVNAVTVDNKQVQAELDRLKQQEEKKREQEQKHQRKLKAQAEAAEKKRKSEERRLAELKKQQEQEQQKSKAEQQHLAELKKQQQQAEQKRKAEEEKQRQAEEARKKAEDARKKAEAEQKRLAEAKRKAEEEKKRKAAEAALQKQLAAEQKQRDAEQARRDMSVINQYGERIKHAIRQEFNTVGLPEGLSCVFVIRMIPGGQVVEEHIVKSSGNDIFDRRAETALSKASPLPVPDDPRLFEKMREIRLTFEPKS